MPELEQNISRGPEQTPSVSERPNNGFCPPSYYGLLGLPGHKITCGQLDSTCLSCGRSPKSANWGSLTKKGHISI